MYMYRDDTAAYHRRAERGEAHPVNKGSWVAYRRQFEIWRNWETPTACQWCENRLDTFGHERGWDAIRKIWHPGGQRIGYIMMPPWFPSTVCSECAKYLTPYVQVVCDIKLVEVYSSHLERIIKDVRGTKGRRTQVNWAAPIPISECGALCD